MNNNYNGDPEVKRIPDVLRWILVVPIGVIASALAWLAFVAVKYLNIFFGTAVAVRYENTLWMAGLEGFSMGVAFALAGRWVAPSNKKIVSYLLAGLALATVLALYFWVIEVAGSMPSDYWSWAVGFVFASGIVASGIAEK